MILLKRKIENLSEAKRHVEKFKENLHRRYDVRVKLAQGGRCWEGSLSSFFKLKEEEIIKSKKFLSKNSMVLVTGGYRED